MTKADDIFWRQFGIILGALTLFAIIVWFIARAIGGQAFEQMINSPSSIAERIEPAMNVRVGDPTKTVEAEPTSVAAAAPAASDAPAGGESVYQSVCSACHVAGVAGAPKLDDVAAWAPRLESGVDALIASVVNGKGAMPPKGGNPSLSEDQIRAAVEYMLAKVNGEEPPAKSAAGSGGATATAMSGAKKAVESATDSAAAMAAQAGEKTTQMAGDAADAAKQVAAMAAAGGAAVPAPKSDGKPGSEVYNSVCVACHVSGVANAPKLGDKAAWEPRVAQGFEALTQSVANGKGAMPPKGGNPSLSEADIHNAVVHMLEQAGFGSGG